MKHPFVPVPGTLQVNIRFTLAGQRVENVLCFRYQGTPFGTACSGIQAMLGAEWWNPIRGAISNQMVHVENYYTDLSSQAGPVYTGGAFSAPSGGHGSPAMSNNVAFVITHRTANRGKSYRGRSYIAGIGRDFVTGNVVADTAIAVFQAGFNNLREAGNVALVPFVIVSRKHDGNYRTEGLSTVVTNCLARDNRVDTQRGRLPR